MTELDTRQRAMTDRQRAGQPALPGTPRARIDLALVLLHPPAATRPGNRVTSPVVLWFKRRRSLLAELREVLDANVDLHAQVERLRSERDEARADVVSVLPAVSREGTS